jgi:acetyl-CoA acetyltransferase
LAKHPFRDVAIVGVFNTAQARVLEGCDSASVAFEAALGALDDAGLSLRQVDGLVGGVVGDLAYQGRLGPVWQSFARPALPAVVEAAGAIANGLATTVLIGDGQAGSYTERACTAPWDHPHNEFTVAYGMFTAAEFALPARRHMHLYGTPPEALATVASTIRNNGHVNPEAVYYGRGPYTPADILASRMIADPFHLLDCSMTAEGGSAMVLTTAERARDLAKKPIFVHGANSDFFGPSYQHPPSFDLRGAGQSDVVDGWVGRRAAAMAWAMSGLGPDDVDVCEFYDPFSFEIIRQFEAFGFCKEGEGGDFVLDGTAGPDGRYPVTTDGGTMSFSHAGAVQLLQRAIRGVQQLRGECLSRQVEGAEVAMCTNGGAGALFTDVLLLGSEQP